MNKMKRKSIICMLSLSMMLGMFSTSCQDMLSPNSDRHAYASAKDTLYSYWGILRSLQNIAERYVILNECRGDLVDASGYISDTIAAIVDFGNVSDPEKWKDGACAYLQLNDYYHVINSCNAYIAHCDTTLVTGTNQPYMLKEYSQVQAIRAWVYMQLLYAYGPDKVPFYTEPMLATDPINNYLADKNHKLVNSQVLAEELAPVLERMEVVEKTYGLPQYNNYGYPSIICHSSMCMFPVSIVLGDLYLLNNQYADAAMHYFNFIKSKNGGPLVVDNYYCRGDLDDRLDYPIYDNYGDPYSQTSAVSKSRETITCILSNMSKLDGKVLTDINRLFGFEAELEIFTNALTIQTEDEKTTYDVNTVSLTRKYERELIPSKGYEALCDSQKYEIYVGTKSGNNFTYESLEELPGVGDARRTWIYSSLGSQWNFRVGDDLLYGKMVHKQNPDGFYSTTYPVIYRKSTVWLRFAEALNRAGFPSYAFAILKTGLCDNYQWFPPKPSATYDNYFPTIDGIKYFIPLKLGQNPFYYEVGDSLLAYREMKTIVDEEGQEYTYSEYLPKGWDTNEQMHSLAELETWLTNYFQKEYDDSQTTDNPMEAPRQIDENNIIWIPSGPDAIKNTPRTGTGAAYACYYLDRRELERADDMPFLNIKEITGQNQSQTIYYKEQGKLFTRSSNTERFPTDTYSNVLYTIGVHQRGCGFIRFDDPEEYRSSYTYVDQVAKKIKQATGKVLTADDIYGGQYDAEVQDAVEDLIIDECGLELAFEGTRFSDLCRVSMRRNNPDYLAEHVSKRHTGKVDENLRSWLQDMNHWFLPTK